jgi:hypothetical protein
MELNDESEQESAGTNGQAPEEKAGLADEAEIEADVASYESKLVGENEADEVETREELVAGEDSAAGEYPRPYEPPLHPIAKRPSLLKRLKPYYLTAAGLLLIARIVVYSLRRRRR